MSNRYAIGKVRKDNNTITRWRVYHEHDDGTRVTIADKHTRKAATTTARLLAGAGGTITYDYEKPHRKGK